MNAAPDPIISEFATQEQASSYDKRFRVKMHETIDSNKPRIPHDKAMARVAAMLEAKTQAHAGRSVA